MLLVRFFALEAFEPFERMLQLGSVVSTVYRFRPAQMSFRSGKKKHQADRPKPDGKGFAGGFAPSGPRRGQDNDALV